MESIITLLAQFGITAETKPFIVLAALMGIGFWYVKRSISGDLAIISDRLSFLGDRFEILKDNMIVVTTHLCTGTGNLDVGLIKQMSPLQIQPDGMIVLEESGFIEAFDVNKEKFFAIIKESNPSSKLEVETFGIYSYIQLIRDNTIMSKVKSYLYDNPDIRDTFPTLAGVYIRDRYLEINTDIQ